MLKVLDLFSGIGGMSLGLKWAGGFETVAFCEIEKYPQEFLKKHWPGVPVYDDIRQLTADRLVRDGIGRIQVITGGYPCQPFSVAGQQRGEADDRHLWPEMLRLIAEVRPSWVICENVTGHIKLGLDQVLSDLEAEGYSSRTFIIPACSVNAPHRRDRLWLISKKDDTNPIGKRLHREEKHKQRDTEPPDREIGDAGQVCEVLARSSHAGIRASKDVAHTERDGFAPAEKRRGVKKTIRGKQKGSERTFDTEGASGLPATGEDVADTNKLTRGSREVHRKPSDKGRAASTAGGESIRSENNEAYASNPATCGEDVADSGSTRSETRVSGSVKREEGVAGKSLDSGNQHGGGQTGNHWAVEPGVGRVAHGIPRRVARLKGLGNAVVPQIPMTLGKAILEYEKVQILQDKT
jgi:DNA-cytosine methyltransferase